MGDEPAGNAGIEDALRPFAPGSPVAIEAGQTRLEITPAAGGRIARLTHAGVDWLIGHHATRAAMIAWGSFPMVPWAGRVRRSGFRFEGREYRLPANLGAHAIHGVGFALPWRVDAHAPDHVELSLALPADNRWPFGGIARQCIEVGDRQVSMQLSVTAGDRAMPATIGWHPWFRKPDRIDFSPRAIYPRDDDGIAVPPAIAPTPGPWDDCFVNEDAVVLHLAGQALHLTSDCDHWVVYDETAHATCVEPQSGPPDALNLQPQVLAPGQTLGRWFRLAWA